MFITKFLGQLNVCFLLRTIIYRFTDWFVGLVSSELWGMTSTLDAGLRATSQYSEGPTTGHLNTGFSWFPCVYKQMLRWFPIFQVATTCFSCSPPDLNLVVNIFIFCLHVK